MPIEERIMKAALESNSALNSTLKKIIKDDLRMSISEFSEAARIPQSTLYKLLSGNREPNLRTLRDIIEAARTIKGEQISGTFIAVVGAKPVLDTIERSSMKIKGKTINIREYPAASMDEAIISAVQAERDGAMALVCAPIVSTTIGKILRIPVRIMKPSSSVKRAILEAAMKYMDAKAGEAPE